VLCEVVVTVLEDAIEDVVVDLVGDLVGDLSRFGRFNDSDNKKSCLPTNDYKRLLIDLLDG
jgi:hypothetical protein